MCLCAEVEDVVNSILFLLSDKSNMTNGVTLPVDGGFLACWPTWDTQATPPPNQGPVSYLHCITHTQVHFIHLINPASVQPTDFLSCLWLFVLKSRNLSPLLYSLQWLWRLCIWVLYKSQTSHNVLVSKDIIRCPKTLSDRRSSWQVYLFVLVLRIRETVFFKVKHKTW